jgi:hypothetical protein
MNPLRCMVYRAPGRMCGRPVTMFTPKLGGWTCAACHRRHS